MKYYLFPDVPTGEMLGIIGYSEYPADWEAGKKLQRQHGSRVIFPKMEYEIAAGQYLRLLAEVQSFDGQELFAEYAQAYAEAQDKAGEEIWFWLTHIPAYMAASWTPPWAQTR